MRHVARAVAAISAATLGVAATTVTGVIPAYAAGSASTEILVPNLVQSGVPTTLVAEVAQDASLGFPSGTVTFATGYGGTIGSATLVATSAGKARATLDWTPPPEYSVPLIARYTPTESTVALSTSAYARPLITSASVPVALRLPQVLRAGPITLGAVLGSRFGAGSATFFVDGRGWTGSVLTVNGVASLIWEATPGVHTIVVQYSSSAKNDAGFSVSTGSSTQSVEVLP
jgi:hypothetical protein